MTRICIISDSSVNAIRNGWPLVESDYPECELTYFAAARENMATLEVAGDRVISRDPHCAQRMRVSSKGLEGIADEYDWFMLFALGFNFNLVVHICLTHRVEADVADERVPISDSCLECALQDFLRDSISIATVRKLRQITRAPIAVWPTPMRCRIDANPTLKRMRESGGDGRIKNMAIGLAERLSTEYGFKLFPQPEHTLSSPLNTNSIYARVPGSSDGHMNAAFGKEIWNAFLRRSPEGIL